MTDLSRRRFMKGAGAASLGALAGCTNIHEESDPSDNNSNTDSTDDEGEIEASEPVIDESVEGEVPEDFTDVLREVSYYQKGLLDGHNDDMEQGYFGGRWYDIDSLENTVFPGGALQEETLLENEEDDSALPGKHENDSVQIGNESDGFTYTGEDSQEKEVVQADEKDGFDILTTVYTDPDSADMEDIADPDNGKFILTDMTVPALSYMAHQEIYKAVQGQRGEEYHDEEAYETFEEELTGLGFEIHDHEDNAAELYMSEDEVYQWWEKIEDSVVSGTAQEVFEEEFMSYVEDNTEYSL